MAEADPAGAAKARPETDDAPDDAGDDAHDDADAANDDAAVADTADAPADQSPQAQDPASLSAPELLARLSEVEAENAQAKDGLLRAKAEGENVRRRAHNEMIAARKYAIEGFAQELLVVKDSLDQAAAIEIAADAGDALQQMKEGINLTRKQLDIALAKFAVVEVDAAPGVRFDPEQHQAISMTPSAEIAADHIVAVVQKGFTIKQRLLRPAMVVVASAVASGAAAAPAAEPKAKPKAK